MAEFSLDLNEDQQQIQKWVHDFAEQVVRPAGHEWDERETPWPVIEEAAKIGLYSWEFMAQCFSDPTGLLFPVVSEEMCWGDAGISLAIFGSTLGAAGIAGNGTPEQIAEWVPQCFGTPDDIHLSSFCVTEPGAGSDVSSLRTNAKKDGDDWVINGQKTFITNGGLLGRPNVHVVVASVDPELGSRGHASSSRYPGLTGEEGRRWASAPRTGEVLFDDAHPELVPPRRLESRLARA
jgi:acyl-CoA dehydrogenase